METISETQDSAVVVAAAAAAAAVEDDFMCDRGSPLLEGASIDDDLTTPQINTPPLVEPAPIVTEAAAAMKDKSYSKYRPLVQESMTGVVETDLSKLDQYLEQEKLSNRNESWNKLDRGMKIQKLHIYAETYAKENKLPAKEIRALKLFFTDCVNKNKLQKAKEVSYDKTAGVILNIPSLAIHATTRNFTLRNLDNKRVSTLKSLTPKRTSQSAQASLT